MLNKVCPICNDPVNKSANIADGLVFCTMVCWKEWVYANLDELMMWLPAKVIICKFSNDHWAISNGKENPKLSVAVEVDASLPNSLKEFLVQYWKKLLSAGY